MLKIDEALILDPLVSAAEVTVPVLNWVLFILVAVAVLVGAATGTMPAVEQAVGKSAQTAVDVALSLIAPMAVWLGLMGVLAQAGLLARLAKLLKPLMTWLFPDVPPDHPAMGAMIMNIAANVLGLNNSATPFGLKAMRELNRLSTTPGTATNAMAVFLVINTSGLAVIPTTAIAVRMAASSKNPASILWPSVIATLISTVIAVIICKLLQARWSPATADAALAPSNDTSVSAEVEPLTQEPQLTRNPVRAGAAILAVLLVVLVGARNALSGINLPDSHWQIPVIIFLILAIAFARNAPIYEAFIQGAKESFQTMVTIIPYLVAIILAIGMFRASGALDAITSFLSPFTAAVGFPGEALPMALMRPLSGSGSLAVMTDTIKSSGADSFVGYLVSLIYGSSETTFYVLAVYLGSIQVRRLRHTLAACLIADGLGLIITTVVAHLTFALFA